MITGDTTIGEVVRQKGVSAAEILDSMFCDEKRTCCPGTTLTLGHAAHVRGMTNELPEILERLNALGSC